MNELKVARMLDTFFTLFSTTGNPKSDVIVVDVAREQYSDVQSTQGNVPSLFLSVAHTIRERRSLDKT